MTRAEIKDLMRVRKKDSFGTKRLIVMLKNFGEQKSAYSKEDMIAIRLLLNELKEIRTLNKDKHAH